MDIGVVKGLASYISSQDIDEDICKKVKVCRLEESEDSLDCIECVIEFFSMGCKWLSDNYTSVCTNYQSEHCADFVGEVECGKCKLKELKG